MADGEIVHNGWRLIGKIAVLILVPMFTMALGGAWALNGWRGEITATVENHLKDKHPGVVIDRVTSLEMRATRKDEQYLYLLEAIRRNEELETERFNELKRLISLRNG